MGIINTLFLHIFCQGLLKAKLYSCQAISELMLAYACKTRCYFANMSAQKYLSSQSAASSVRDFNGALGMYHHTLAATPRLAHVQFLIVNFC